MCLKKTIHLTCDHNFDRFTKFFYYQIREEILYAHYQDSPPYLSYVSTLPCELENYNCCRFQWRRPIACEISEFILQDRRPAQVWNLENKAAVLRRGCMILANWSSGWLTCNMGCSSQSLTKLAPVNDVNVCELVFVPDMDVLSTCLTYRLDCNRY